MRAMYSVRVMVALVWIAAGAAVQVRAEHAKSDSSVEGATRPTVARNFRLSDHQGKSWELYRFKDAKAVVLFFAGNGCPIVRKSVPRLSELREAYAAKGVIFLLIDGNASDDRESVVKEAGEYQIDFPILLDEAQLVTKALGASRTAEAFVIQPQGWKIVYRGAIDDQLDYGTTKPQATQNWLRDALDAVLEGKNIEVAETEPKGCLLDIKPDPKKISYTRHIAPILAEKCVACHQDGDVAPFAMDSYESVVAKKRMIREVLLTQRMPPWHADPHFGEFSNNRALSLEQTRRLVAWVDADTPRGDGQDPLVKITPASTGSEWPLGKPDFELPMPTGFEVPASGVVPYQYFRVPYTGNEDIWVRAAVVLPGNKEVLHHVLVFIQYPDRLSHLQPDFEGGLEGYFAGYVPGQMSYEFPKGTAKLVPAGSTFVFQIHYTTIGKQETDLSKLGLYLFKGKKPKELLTKATANTDFSIPPGDPESPTTADYTFAKDSLLFELSPHMHYRGKRFQYEAQYPDGRSEVLLAVPNYDFNWQTMYRFDNPKRIPAGTKVICTGAFDNSPGNPSNPDPSIWVEFGEQTFEEMFIGYMGYIDAPDANGKTATAQPMLAAAPQGLGKAITQETIVGTIWRTGPYRLLFQNDGKLLVGKHMEGTWAMDGDRIVANVRGRDYVLIVKGDQLYDDDGEALEPVTS